jgi:YidC/Oxa1 family membrane protein insertase
MAKRKAKGKQSFWDKMQEAATGQAASAASSANENNPKVNREAATTSLKNYTSNTMNSNSNSNTRYREGSLAAKANAMQRYNDKGGKN